MISNMENEMGPHPIVVPSEFVVSGFNVLYIFCFFVVVVLCIVVEVTILKNKERCNKTQMNI